MIHVSIETIPAKMYFRIQETGSVELLTDEKKPDIPKLQEIWAELKKQHGKLPESHERKRTHSLYVRLEQLSAKLESTTLAIHHLQSLFDQELLEILISYEYLTEGYVVKSQEQFQKDLKKIFRETEALQIKMDAIKIRLPKVKDEKKITFDQSVMAYAAFTGSGFIDPNLITLTQYYALVNMGKDKIKSLENGKG